MPEFVKSSIRWNLLQLFWTNRFDPDALQLQQINQWWWKIACDRLTESDLSDYWDHPQLLFFHPTLILRLGGQSEIVIWLIILKN